MATDSTFLQVRVGPQTSADGVSNTARADKTLALVTTDAHGRFHEAVSRGNVFSLVNQLTSTGIGAGHLVSAAAAAACQFVVWNPVGSGVLVSILKFGYGVVSGTPTGGPMLHGILSTAPTIATTATAGAAYNHYIGGSAPSARYVNTAASSGTATTGASAVVPLRIANFSSTNTAQASVGLLAAVEEMNGDIVLPPGTGWLPLHPGAGTSVLSAYSVTWEEITIP